VNIAETIGHAAIALIAAPFIVGLTACILIAAACVVHVIINGRDK
jgi:hypothetical protein